MWFQASSGLLLLLLSPCLAVQFREPPAPTRQSTRTPVEGWIDVRLNHFMASDTQTFKMRYYYNDEFAADNIVIVVGGEWQITPGYLTGGLAYELAEKSRAALFYTEHRFYGLTRPFEDTSLPGLAYLTVDQALADLAQFIEYVKSDNFENGRYRLPQVLRKRTKVTVIARRMSLQKLQWIGRLCRGLMMEQTDLRVETVGRFQDN
ncbi:unnamed protein product [Arctia plantaginis]|uniref:Serine protease K12H4.7 n=2 Tax=Arctia plantaginis TaxID=874455 RepID=A0A8S1AA85_ARCPL|nr:unnamed protein product [Arctia plantaginis]